MHKKIILCILAASLALNTLCIVFFVLALSSKTASVSLTNPGGAYITGVCAVSVPKDGEGIVFDPAEFSLKPGERAHIQFSLLLDGKQINMAVEPLYDRDIVEVERSPFGLVITALSPGEAVLQTVTADGIRDVARVTVLGAPPYTPRQGGPQVKAD